MPENPFLEIDAAHLGVLEGEASELINDGTFGKALAEYLQARLRTLDYEIPCVVCEDWGWYVAVLVDGFRLGICVYGFPREPDDAATSAGKNQGSTLSDDSVVPPGTPLSLCVQVATKPRKYWDWRRFRFVDRSPAVHRLNQDLKVVLENDPEIKLVRCCEEFPLG